MPAAKGTFSHLKAVIRDGLTYMPGSLIPSLVAFLALPFLTRFLGPDRYGVLSLFVTGITFVSILCFSWISNAVVRFFAEEKSAGSLPEFIATTAALFVSISVATVGLFLALSRFIDSESLRPFLEGSRWAIAGIFVANSLFLLELSLLRADRQPRKYSFYAALEALLRTGIGLWLMTRARNPLNGVLIGIFIGTFAVAAALAVDLARQFRAPSPAVSRRILIRFGAYGAPLLAANVLDWLLTFADRYLLAALADTHAVGVYSAGYTLAEKGILVWSSILMLSAFPVVLQVHAGGEAGVTERLLRQLTRMYVVLFVGLAMTISVCSGEIARILLGEKFLEAGPVIPWVTSGAFLLGLSQYINKPFELKNKTHVLAVLLGMATAVNIALNFLLIPRLGAVGAAIATFAAYALYTGVSFLAAERLMPVGFPVPTLFRCLAAGLAAAFASLQFAAHVPWTPWPVLIGKGLLAAAIYFIALGLMREKVVVSTVRKAVAVFR
jgi:O-antigen/teichoic acid export membrane protein